MIASGGRCDLDRGNAIERSHFAGNFDAGHDRGLGVDHRGIGFDGALMDPERHPSPAKRAGVDIRRPGHLLEESGLSFENRRRPGEAAPGQQGSEHRIARGFGVRESLPVGQRLHPGLGHRNMVVDGKVDRLCQLLGTELHQFARGERHGRK